MIETLLSRVFSCIKSSSLLHLIKKTGDGSYNIYLSPNLNNHVYVKSLDKLLIDTKLR